MKIKREPMGIVEKADKTSKDAGIHSNVSLGQHKYTNSLRMRRYIHMYTSHCIT